MTVKFQLPNNYYIRNLDHKNWIIAKSCTAKKSGKEKEYIEGYYPTLIRTYNSAINSLALQAKDLTDLHEILAKMEELKITIQNHGN